MCCWLPCVQLDPTATPIHEVEDIASLTADTSTTGAPCRGSHAHIQGLEGSLDESPGPPSTNLAWLRSRFVCDTTPLHASAPWAGHGARASASVSRAQLHCHVHACTVMTACPVCRGPRCVLLDCCCRWPAGTQWGTGGMVTKLTAARIATGGCRLPTTRGGLWLGRGVLCAASWLF